ncbi:MAG TPA: protein kinase [Gemmatimonadales bacterium]|nr:protein kinase [Gemmatimonadales bacterium]
MTASGTSSLTWRIFLGAAGVVAAVLAATMLLAWLSVRGTIWSEVDRSLDRTRQLVVTFLQGDRRSLARGAAVFAQNPNFRALLENPGPGDMLDQSLEAAELLGASFVQITDGQGVRLARSDEPAAPPAPLAGSPLIAGALQGETTSGIGVAGDSTLFQAVAVPILGGSNVIAGSLMAAKTIDSSLARAVKRATESDVVFFALDSAGQARIAASTLPPDAALAAFVAAHGPDIARDSGRGSPGPSHAHVDIGEGRYFAQGGALLSAGGAPLGGFLALRSRAVELAGFRDLGVRIALAGLVGLLLAFGFSWVVARRISRPVQALAAATHRAAEGDYGAPIEPEGPAEIRALAEAFRVLLLELREKQSLVDVLRGREERRGVSQAGRASAVTLPAGEGRLAPGQLFAGRYEVLSPLGEGGMGVVYKARDRDLGDIVALKLVRSEAMQVDPNALERLKDEVRLARRISHRNVARTHDFGETDGIYYVTMEYVAGTALKELLKTRGRLPVDATVSVGKQLCRALEAAHEQGIIHRDVKPQNIIVAPDGLVKVMDFGIARPVHRAEKGMTATGLVVGTPEYMAPEQLMGEALDPRVDLYGVGVVLYECLTGRRPHDADTAMAMVTKVLTERPVPPHEVAPEVPDGLSALIVRALAKERDERPRSAGEMYEELVRVTEGVTV